MSPRTKILDHPDKDEIIKWILDGISVRDIALRLRERYPKKSQAHLRVSASTVQNFKSDFLNLKGEILGLAKEELESRKEHVRLEQAKERHELIQDEVRKTTPYQEKISEMVDMQLNVQGELIKLYKLIDFRMEYFFNKLQEHEFPNVKEERVFQNYIDQFMKLLEHYKRFVEGYNDKVEHNININVMNDQMTELREAVREVLSETSPELSVIFMQKLNLKMKNLEYRAGGHAGSNYITNDLFGGEVLVQDVD